MAYELPELPYPVDSLEPYMDAKTLEIHHGKHHSGYVAKLNAAVERYPGLQDKSINEILLDLDSVPEDIRTAVKNNGGGHANHSMFWEIMIPDSEGPSDKVKEIISKNFGSFEDFKEKFTAVSVGFFGSGWCWLVRGQESKLEIITTKDHDSPISLGKKPVLVIDLWEHAYYLKYQNRRPEFVDAFWSLINWKKVEENLFN